MTILHVSDFHFNKRWFDWLLHCAPAHDLVVMTGDLLDLAHPVPHRRQIDWVASWLDDHPGPLCVCSGNHDLTWDDASDRWTPAYWLRSRRNPRVWSDGQRVTLDGLSLLNIGCTTRPKGSEADVWVVHAPPAHTLVAARSTGGDGGDPDLVVPVKRYAPRLVLSGHVHNPVHWYDRDGASLLLNPGHDAAAPFPNHILIQTEGMSWEYRTARGNGHLSGVEAGSLTEELAMPVSAGV